VSDPTASELRATVDELAIRGLIAGYADVVDRRTWNEFDDLFLPDAPVTLDLRDRPAMEFVGPGAIGEFIAGALEQYPFFEFVALNVRVALDESDADRAQVRTYMCELRQDHAGTPSRAFGVYQDVVVRDPRRSRHWRFARRHYQSIGRGEQGLDLMPVPEIL
jgi:hypothetical protein